MVLLDGSYVKLYHAVRMVFLTVCGIMGQITAYTNSTKMENMHAMYSSLTTGVKLANWRRLWIWTGIKPFGVDMGENRNEVVGAFFLCARK